jgi:hypothetical protein
MAIKYPRIGLQIQSNPKSLQKLLQRSILTL